MAKATTVEIPEKIGKCLLTPKRYKVLYGGRGSAKSWSVARVLLLLAGSRKLLIVCAREIQKSIEQSVHRLLRDQISAMGMGSFYEIQETKIINKLTGSEFIFVGLRHNVQNIKSLEGADIVWVEEAQSVSGSSLDVLIPTVRREGSEIWFTFNPDLDEDAVYDRFVLNPPDNASVVRVNWSDNPWFPDVLDEERRALKVRSQDSYMHVWEGHTKKALEGAIFAQELIEAEQEGRIGKFPPISTHPVHTWMDLGFADCTSIWLMQTIGSEFRFVGFIQNRLTKIQWYINEINRRGYMLGKHHLPHDARHQSVNADRTTEEIFINAFGRSNVTVLPPRPSKADFTPARTIFPQCVFDAKGCADGLHALKRYRYEYDQDTKRWGRNPVHDENSHAADAFHYAAMTATSPTKKLRSEPVSLKLHRVA